MTALLRELRAAIDEDGPITVARYMALALGHPVHGYYMTRDPLGRDGDFVTAPEVSQMFGELVGLWCCEVWQALGRPRRLALVELGPGRGTLMADALRAARVVPAFLEAVSVHLVETSPALRDRQRRRLDGAPAPVRWHGGFEEVPSGAPAIVLGNEFLDALPVSQFVRGERGWHERLVGSGPDGTLRFGLARDAEPALAALPGRPGDLREVGAAAALAVGAVARRLVAEGGAALFLDYGRADPGPGSTLQALAGHRRADPLAAPGEADLTAHVDFGAVARAAAAAGAWVHGPAGQGRFLRALGIAERARRLADAAGAEGRLALEAAVRRLAGTGEGEMGELFQAIGISGPALPALPGLARAAAAPGTGAAGRRTADCADVPRRRPAC